MSQSSEDLLELIYGFTKSQAIFVAAKLAIADLLSDGGKSSNELAQLTGVEKIWIDQLMGMLTAIDVFTQSPDGLFFLRPTGAYLMSNNSSSLRGTALAMGELLYTAWGHLLYGVRANETPFLDVFGTTVYQYLGRSPEITKDFNTWMQETTREWVLPVLESYDFSGIKTVVDVGGNTGALTAAILRRNPQMQSVLFDQEEIVAKASILLEANKVSDRCQLVGGDFFESIPEGGDLYLLSRVLLNWDDFHALKILKNCRRAMSSQSRLLIVDFLLSKSPATWLSPMISLNLFVLQGFFMRTGEQFCDLLGSAGFEVEKMIHTGLTSAITARPKE